MKKASAASLDKDERNFDKFRGLNGKLSADNKPVISAVDCASGKANEQKRAGKEAQRKNRKRHTHRHNSFNVLQKPQQDIINNNADYHRGKLLDMGGL